MQVRLRLAVELRSPCLWLLRLVARYHACFRNAYRMLDIC